MTQAQTHRQVVAEEERDPVSRVIIASMVGTAIEFFDFYAYGTAAALYFPKVFFTSEAPVVATMLSLLTFGVAFIARPVGSFLFGHFGDRLGRKRTLIASLLTMGISTVVIGLLPGYASIGMAAVVLLCICRFVQGIGLGGEWSGAASVATENAPDDKRARYGSFPQLGSPVGFFLSNGLFLILGSTLTPQQMLSFGWRIPFLVSALLVVVGIISRFMLHETPIFRAVSKLQETSRLPLIDVFRLSWRQIIQGTFIVAVTYTIFYTCATWSLSYGTTKLGFSYNQYLGMLLIGVVSMAVFILVSTRLSDHFGRRRVMMISAALVIVFAIVFPFLLTGTRNFAAILVFLIIGFGLMGTSFGPVAAVLPELFATKVRYSGAGISYNLAAILGAAFLPSLTTYLVSKGGVHAAGIYLGVMAIAALISFLTMKETKDLDFTR